jgi:hypothetical protein
MSARLRPGLGCRLKIGARLSVRLIRRWKERVREFKNLEKLYEILEIQLLRKLTDPE